MRKKLELQLIKLKELKSSSELINWIEYQIDMYDQGSFVVKPNILPYEGQWVPKKVSYEGFMNWKVQKKLSHEE